MKVTTALLLRSLPLLLLLLPAKDSQAETDHLKSLLGQWKVTAVRLDETLMRRPNYNINDPELVGRWILVHRHLIRTNMPEETMCRNPSIMEEISTIEELVDRTMGKAEYSEKVANKFRLPINPRRRLQVLWVKCREGDIGPDTPSGPEGYNWIARLSPNKLAMRWYDNTIIVLERQRR